MSADALAPELREALIKCRRVTQRRARNFYYGLRLAPEPKRAALFVLYAWMREVDDITDDEERPAAARRESLIRYRAATLEALNGEIGDDRAWLWRALHHIAANYALHPEHFSEMIEGQLSDLGSVDYAMFDELRRYCCRVGSTVGLLCLGIWGFEGADAPELATDRGIAFQLTNILRDFAQDFDGDRLYLPAEDFRRHAITPQQLRTWSEPARCERFMSEQIERARSYYERSRALDERISHDCVPVLWAMTRIYREVLEKIAASPERATTGRRARLSTIRKGIIALEAGRMARSAAKEQA